MLGKLASLKMRRIRSPIWTAEPGGSLPKRAHVKQRSSDSAGILNPTGPETEKQAQASRHHKCYDSCWRRMKRWSSSARSVLTQSPSQPWTLCCCRLKSQVLGHLHLRCCQPWRLVFLGGKLVEWRSHPAAPSACAAAVWSLEAGLGTRPKYSATP